MMQDLFLPDTLVVASSFTRTYYCTVTNTCTHVRVYPYIHIKLSSFNAGIDMYIINFYRPKTQAYKSVTVSKTTGTEIK